MTRSEPDRRKVHHRLVDIIGQPEADLIMHLFPTPDLTSQIADLRGELHIEMAGLRAEVKRDIAALRSETRAFTGKLRSELKDDIATLRTETRVGFAEVDTKFAHVDA